MTTASDLRKTRLAKRDEFRKERFEVVVASAENALKNAFLVNGGGAVALLAFFGQASKQPGFSSVWLARSEHHSREHSPGHAFLFLLRRCRFRRVCGAAVRANRLVETDAQGWPRLRRSCSLVAAHLRR